MIRPIQILLLLAGIVLASCSQGRKQTTPPNIIVFLVDDMGLMDTSVPFMCDFTGAPVRYPLNDWYRTPNMERLAAQGVRFSNFYAHSVCSPSRVTIMTGQNSARHGVTTWINPQINNRGEFGPSDWNWQGLDSTAVTLPRMLQQAGYKTIHVGKAHFGPFGSVGEDPLHLGFDANIGGGSIGRPGSYYGEDGYGLIRGDSVRAVPGLEKYHGKDIFLTEALTREANAEIARAAEQGKPFYLYMAHYAVHSPFQPDKRFIDHYTASEKSDRAKAYAALIEGIDTSLGDIMKQVEALELGRETLILFLGDNGSDAPLPMPDNYGSSFPLKGKKAMHWEGGMRVPFIAAWITPDKRERCQKKTPVGAGAIQTQTGTIMDLFPTLCQVAGLHIPKGYTLDGFPLQEQLRGKVNPQRNERFMNHFPHRHRSSYYTSMVDADWKVIYHYPVEDAPQYELYNMARDPFEKHNLAEENPEQLRVMMEALQQELEATGALPPEVDGKPLSPVIP